MKYYFLILFLLPVSVLQAQDMKYTHSILDSLCSPSFHGRGYEFRGDSVAADFLAREFSAIGLETVNGSYFQPYSFPVNTHQGAMEVLLNDSTLTPAVDYLLHAASPSIDGKFEVQIVDKSTFASNRAWNKFVKKDFSKTFLYVDTTDTNADIKQLCEAIVYQNAVNAAGLIVPVHGNLTYSPATYTFPAPVLQIKEDILHSNIPQKIEIHAPAIFVAQYPTQNIIGKISGQTDTCLVFTAHYDHLGHMGKDVYFPGAHDNASGVAMLLNLARYYVALPEKPHYTIVLMLFSGEEAGLLGSKYYVEHPIFPLSKIRFLLNIDLMGSGEEGVQVVNGTEFRPEFDRLTALNTEKNYLKAVKIRGAAANSDHYFFYTHNVPSFFIYTLGAYKEYHNIYDRSESVPLNAFESIFHLFVNFADGF